MGQAYLRLGVNIDHVATIRNARGGGHPEPVRAAKAAIEAGANGITAHLREDRRHISDDDIQALMHEVSAPLNLEMAVTDEMVVIALQHKPHAVCLVPERREERTTEGGINAVEQRERIAPVVKRLTAAGIRVSLFIEPSVAQIEAAHELGADAVELHTGAYCNAAPGERSGYLTRIEQAAAFAVRCGLECHAGHGLNFETVEPIARIPHIVELNIGHFLIGEAIFCGLEASITRMREVMDRGREAIASEI